MSTSLLFTLVFVVFIGSPADAALPISKAAYCADIISKMKPSHFIQSVSRTNTRISIEAFSDFKKEKLLFSEAVTSQSVSGTSFDADTRTKAQLFSRVTEIEKQFAEHLQDDSRGFLGTTINGYNSILSEISKTGDNKRQLAPSLFGRLFQFSLGAASTLSSTGVICIIAGMAVDGHNISNLVRVGIIAAVLHPFLDFRGTRGFWKSLYHEQEAREKKLKEIIYDRSSAGRWYYDSLDYMVDPQTVAGVLENAPELKELVGLDLGHYPSLLKLLFKRSPVKISIDRLFYINPANRQPQLVTLVRGNIPLNFKANGPKSPRKTNEDFKSDRIELWGLPALGGIR